MKAILAKHGSMAKDSDAFTLIEQDKPKAEGKDILVKVEAIGMNPVDYKVRELWETDVVLGWDAYGTVEALGKDAKGFAEGDKVFYAGDITRPGTNSEYHLVDHRIVAKAPEKVTPEQSAAMPLTAVTAWEALFDRMGFVAEKDANRGRSILIVGGAGGVGSVAIQIARWAGLKVYATASRPETSDWCKKLGADVIINHRNNLAEEIKQSGVDFVDSILCTTGAEAHWQAMADAIAPQGRLVIIDDPDNNLDIRLFKLKSAAIMWEFMYTRSMFQTEDIEEQGKLLSEIARLMDEGEITSTLQETLDGLTVENIRQMHIKQASGTMMGKQVLRV